MFRGLLNMMAVGLVLGFSVVGLARPLNSSQVYDIYLYFDETEFVDTLSLSHSPDGELQGHMVVPNDFEGDVENLEVSAGQIEFDLFVPHNSARPKDLIFHYRADFRDSSHQVFEGNVTLRGERKFIARFRGVRRV